MISGVRHARGPAGNHLQRRGRDRGARPQAVDGDAERPEFGGMAQRAHAHAVLGHRVGRRAARTSVGIEVSGGDMRQHVRLAAGLGAAAQVRQAGLRAEIGAAHVDAEHQVEALHRRCRRRREADGAGVVDQDVDAAEALDGLRHGRLRRLASSRMSRRTASAWPPAASISSAAAVDRARQASGWPRWSWRRARCSRRRARRAARWPGRCRARRR